MVDYKNNAGSDNQESSASDRTSTSQQQRRNVGFSNGSNSGIFITGSVHGRFIPAIITGDGNSITIQTSRNNHNQGARSETSSGDSGEASTPQEVTEEVNVNESTVATETSSDAGELEQNDNDVVHFESNGPMVVTGPVKFDSLCVSLGPKN